MYNMQDVNDTICEKVAAQNLRTMENTIIVTELWCAS